VPAVLAASAIAHATAGGGVTAPAIVTVGDGPGAVATGFSVSPGRFVTVAHVLDGDAIAVRGDDGIVRRATVVRRDDALDLALLAVPGIEAAAALRPAGTRLLVHRDGAATTLPAHIVRRVTARVRRAGVSGFVRRPALELAASPASGDSGAPVLSDGRVTGIVFARSHDRPGVAYAVDASVLERFTR
jgi:S1-C subfamily serine protease